MPEETVEIQPERTGGKEAVCFTAGPAGAVFASGAIHAWLAADRLPPTAAAGISTGSLSAAAMQRAYRELEAYTRKVGKSDNHLETARWTWFRKYLGAVSESRLDFIWKAFPNPVDFFADQPPVRDRSCPKALIEPEREARIHYYRLTKLGVWLGGLPIRVSTFASLITHYVRAKERYAIWPVQWCLVFWHALKVGAGLLRHIAFKPLFWSDLGFAEGKKGQLPWKAGFRPLLGWKTWLTATAQIAFILLGALSVVWWFVDRPAGFLERVALSVFTASPFLILAIIAVQLSKLLHGREMKGKHQALGIGLLKALGIEQGLLRDYELHRRLLELFGELDQDGELQDALIQADPMHVVIVASPLEGIRKDERLRFEAVAGPREHLVQALRAALAIPGIFPPVTAAPENWGITAEQAGLKPGSNEKLHLVDGVVFRQNPLPRFLSWLGQPEREDLQVDVVRMVYNVPIEPKADAKPRDSVNIIHATLESLKLEKRRDTRQQARQVRFLTKLHKVTGHGKIGSDRRFVAVDVTEIAPKAEISFANRLDPKRKEVLRHAAKGCRRTLEALYGPEQAKDEDRRVPCSEFLVTIAPRRLGFITKTSPGLPEVCSKCTRVLHFRTPRSEEAPDRGVQRSFGTLKPGDTVNLHVEDHTYARLDGSKQAIVVMASGGVFRGVTHIGFLGALVATGIRPDLVIGASVGALLGAALCALSDMPAENQRARLGMLTDLFRRVDEKVALTWPLKNALKHLGIRARRVQLSPAAIRQMIRKGAHADAGFAATGAPSALIDAISELFLIPHKETAAIARQFVAGHFTKAAKLFWEQVQNETLPKLDIETALMGTSLLHAQARELIRPHTAGPQDEWYRNTQPYSYSKFFCITSDLNRCAAMVLGRDTLTLTESYDFVEACLSSSAFPAVFSPRRESHVLPGAGKTGVLFSDGGMFDNLPIFPAIEILEKAQLERTGAFPLEEAIQDLRQRSTKPHIFLTAALDADPDETYDGAHGNLSRIYKRANSLKAQVKSQEFEHAASGVGQQIKAFLASGTNTERIELATINRVVVSEIIRIVPSDREHINPTFAFARTLGLKPKRIDSAIANGCFRTLVQIASQQRKGQMTLDSGLPEITRIQENEPASDKCAHFYKKGNSFDCPFAGDGDAGAIRSVCAKDKVHLEELRIFSGGTPPPTTSQT